MFGEGLNDDSDPYMYNLINVCDSWAQASLPLDDRPFCPKRLV